MTGAGCNIHKIIEITDAGRVIRVVCRFIYNVKKKLFFASGECLAIDKNLLMGDYNKMGSSCGRD